VDGHLTGIPLPFAVLAHLPLLDSSIASRYAAFFWLFAALLLVLIVDAVYGYVLAWDQPGDRVRATLLAGGLCVCALVLVLPAWPYGSSPAAVPTWFTTSARSIPVGTTAVVYPLSSPADTSAMLAQAMANMTFRMPGGYAIFPTVQGTATFDSTPSYTGEVLAQCGSGTEPQPLPSMIRKDLSSWNVSLVVVPKSAPGAMCATRVFESVLGPPRESGGVLLWTGPVPGGLR